MKTTREIAALYGVTPSAVCKTARALGIVGVRRGRTMLWTARQVRQLKPRPVGRPRKAVR